LVGKLNHLTFTHPYIFFFVSLVSKFFNSPCHDRWDLVCVCFNVWEPIRRFTLHWKSHNDVWHFFFLFHWALNVGCFQSNTLKLLHWMRFSFHSTKRNFLTAIQTHLSDLDIEVHEECSKQGSNLLNRGKYSSSWILKCKFGWFTWWYAYPILDIVCHWRKFDIIEKYEAKCWSNIDCWSRIRTCLW